MVRARSLRFPVMGSCSASLAASASSTADEATSSPFVFGEGDAVTLTGLTPEDQAAALSELEPSLDILTNLEVHLDDAVNNDEISVLGLPF
jgi:hypothetical protein